MVDAGRFRDSRLLLILPLLFDTRKKCMRQVRRWHFLTPPSRKMLANKRNKENVHYKARDLVKRLEKGMPGFGIGDLKS